MEFTENMKNNESNWTSFENVRKSILTLIGTQYKNKQTTTGKKREKKKGMGHYSWAGLKRAPDSVIHVTLK